MTTTSNDADLPPLNRTVSLSTSLHTLSLRQIVPIHHALIAAVVPVPTIRTTFVDNDTALLVQQICGEEASYCQKQLLEGNSAELKLLAIQFLLHHVQGLNRLTKVLLPLLPSMEAPSNNEELREALLDAVFDGISAEEEEESSFKAIDLQQGGGGGVPHEWACCILVRLYQLRSSDPMLAQWMVDRVLQGMVSLDTLRPVTRWLLPLMYNETTGMEGPVWDRCVELMQEVLDEKDSSLTHEKVLIVSAVLCTILPHIKVNKDDASITLLWSFISNLLHRGTKVPIKSGSFQYEHAKLDQTLRRRGLYLLRLVISKDEIVWIKYCMCFETLEMETERHLIDQVWDTVRELCLAAAAPPPADSQPMTWDWISAMLSRLFLSDTPVNRKLGMYRFLNGHAGIQISAPEPEEPAPDRPAFQVKPKKKHAIKSKKKPTSGAPLSLVSTDFVLDDIIPSLDTLGASIGTNIQFEHQGKIEAQDVAPKVEEFLTAFVKCLDSERLQEFMAGVLSAKTLLCLRPKVIVMVLTTVAQAAPSSTTISQEVLTTAIQLLSQLFGSGSIVITYRHSLLQALAIILSKTQQGNFDHHTILRVLTLYPLNLAEEDTEDRFDHPTYKALQQWIASLGTSSSWASSTASTCASAFVQMQLMPRTEWDPIEATSNLERSTGGAIVLLAALSQEEGSGSLLWPAIHKGLGSSPSPAMEWYNADKASRALILLENGCRLELLSGMGNGDLVLDKKTQHMMPPPPNIEQLLLNSVGFLLNHVRALASLAKSKSADSTMSVSGSTRSGNTTKISTTLSHVIGQLKVFAESYPSSMAVSSASEEMLESSVKTIMLLKDTDGIDVVTYTSLTYAALSCGANPVFECDGISTADACAKLLRLDFAGARGVLSRIDEQTARSIFHYSRWGCLSMMLPALLEEEDDDKSSSDDLTPLLEEVFARALDLAEATPADALLPLFDSVRAAATSWLSLQTDKNSYEYATHLSSVIQAMFTAMTECSASTTATYMLNQICGLLFRPAILLDEYERLQEDPDYEAPVRKAFLKLVKMSGKVRSYILKAALCHICAGWLDKDTPGLGAIPYQKELVNLLVHKERKLEEASIHQSILTGSSQASDTALTVPAETNARSVARSFLLVFLSRLPDPTNGLDPRVLTELLHPVILGLFKDVCSTTLKHGSSLMTGTEDYSIRIRGWQALCILSRFVTSDIAEEVCDCTFKTLQHNLHGQIRYFMEIFMIQCARKHPRVFGSRFVQEIQRADLTLQQVGSLMVLGGNLIVGNYKLDFFRQFEAGENGNLTLHQVLSGVIPWLSSTQGFSRAIAQALVHELIPLVLDVTSAGDNLDDASDDWYLRNLYIFLDKNPEMKRLRKKQLKIFGRYDADHTCTVEGLMSFKVDESDEANPEYTVELVKKCLEEVYMEAHANDTPVWKQVAKMMITEEPTTAAAADNVALVNFQRKIIPLDALDLALEESRDQRLRNVLGRKRQSLVICASLVDKVPNLGGLARTAEIFAADRLVIPDISIVRMDNFKSISVGAGEWIQIEECKEDGLLAWLREKQEDGYTIVGLEQTSSSISIENYKFPQKTVLLLGKEKEGIPVEYLQFVDQCVEIPQLGIIRSMNVHVSGAICIWEYSKQLLAATANK